MPPSPRSRTLARYEAHLRGTADWLVESARPPTQGSSAFVWAFGRRAAPYPETTGYIIPTLLAYARRSGSAQHREVATALGSWLLGIQAREGCWHGGTHPPARPNPSVFNTAQILLGLCALHREHGEPRWLEAAQRGATWLARGVDDAGGWPRGNYQEGFTPSYYTRVAWPMLEVWALTGDPALRDAALLVLAAIAAKKQENGAIAGWGFSPGEPAFTHTIAYTLRGLLESARLLDDWRWGEVAEPALERLVRRSELAGGRLPGAFDVSWRAKAGYTCLTGDAQLAICFLILHRRAPDLRLVNAAAKLIDTVCASQRLRHPVATLRAAVAGSQPLWGRYMAMRYPNWAAKFHCDALLRLLAALDEAGLK